MKRSHASRQYNRTLQYARPEARPMPSLRAFTLAFLAVLASQLMLYAPGTDVSPWAFSAGRLQPITVLGQTLQTLAFAALIFVVAVGLLSRRSQDAMHGRLWVWLSIGAIATTTVLTASRGLHIDGSLRLVAPLLIYVYLRSRVQEERMASLADLLLVVNLVSVGQVLASKVLTGSFSSHTYYHELTQEFFGYYHHPFAFAGVLGVGAIVCMHQISIGRRASLNVALLLSDLCLIYLTQVRTYMVAVAAALVVAVLGLLIRRRMLGSALLSGLLMLGGLVALVGAGVFASGRMTADYSSGRLDRWVLDVQTFVEDSQGLEVLFGGGPQYIVELNAQLIGVAINSLNLYIDLFVDFGLIGALLFVGALVMIVRDAYSRCDRIFVTALAVFAAVATMITNLFEFPVVGAVLAIALVAVGRQPQRGTLDEDLGSVPTAVPRSPRKQLVVG